MIFAFHTTHIFKILNVVLFGTLKKHATGLDTLDEESWAIAFLLKAIVTSNR
jgi:hypothetical protein